MRAQDPGETKGAADINVDVGGGLGGSLSNIRAPLSTFRNTGAGSGRNAGERSSRHGKRRTREVVDREGLDKGRGRERAWGTLRWRRATRRSADLAGPGQGAMETVTIRSDFERRDL